MYEHAIPSIAEGKRGGLHRLHDMIAADAIEILERAIKDMRNRRDFYVKFNPKNEWGNVSGALEFLVDILDSCKNHPACTIYLSA